jgi:hypothetical protein
MLGILRVVFGSLGYSGHSVDAQGSKDFQLTRHFAVVGGIRVARVIRVVRIVEVVGLPGECWLRLGRNGSVSKIIRLIRPSRDRTSNST